MLLSSDDQLAELRARVAEVETRLNRMEGRASASPVAPRFSAAPAPAASSPPALPVEWPSSWTPPATSEAAPVVSLDTPRVQETAGNSAVSHAPVPAATVPAADALRVAATARKGAVSNAPAQTTNQGGAGAGAPVQAAPVLWGIAETVGVAPNPAVSSSPESREQKPDKSLLDWETLIGGRLALWVGALCLFLAFASLLVYVGQTLPPPTPAMRVASGFGASVALFAGALWGRGRTQRWFVDGFLGAGLAVGFLSVWGGGPHFAFWPLWVSLAGFGLLSALGMALSARRDSQALLVLSATGGFLTPLLVGQNHANGMAVEFLSFLLVLNAGIIAVCTAKKWREIVYGALAATALLSWGWSLGANMNEMRPLVWTFDCLNFGLFAGAACGRALWLSEETEDGDSALLLTASALYAATSQWLLAPLMRGFPGAFSLGMTIVFGALWFVTRRRVPLNAALRANFLVLSCTAGALFVPLQFGAHGLVWGWMAQAVALSIVGRKTTERLLGRSGRALWSLAIVALGVEALSSLWNAGAPFDGFSLRSLFCLGATFVLLFDAPNDEPGRPIYAAFLSWGGALWIGRAVWLAMPRLTFVLPAHRDEAAILIGASAIALWSLTIARAGWWRRQSELCFNGVLVSGAAICAIAGVALWGEAPLVALRIGAFLVGAVTIWLMGNWHEQREEGAGSLGENPVLGVATWILLGLSVEIVAHWNGGQFNVPDTGATAWFALCATWSAFAALVGAVSVWRAWAKLWTLAQSLLAVSLGLLLLQSPLISHSLVPIWNARLGAFALSWMVALLARSVDGNDRQRRGDWWMLALLLLPLWSSTQEVWNWVATHHAEFGSAWQRFASLGVSLLWSFYAAACLIGGVVKRAQQVRMGALGLGALTVCKVFLLDLSFLDGGLRVLSLGGLGMALLLISWLYSRVGTNGKPAGDLTGAPSRFML